MHLLTGCRVIIVSLARGFQCYERVTGGNLFKFILCFDCMLYIMQMGKRKGDFRSHPRKTNPF